MSFFARNHEALLSIAKRLPQLRPGIPCPAADVGIHHDSGKASPLLSGAVPGALPAYQQREVLTHRSQQRSCFRGQARLGCNCMPLVRAVAPTSLLMWQLHANPLTLMALTLMVMPFGACADLVEKTCSLILLSC